VVAGEVEVVAPLLQALSPTARIEAAATTDSTVERMC